MRREIRRIECINEGGRRFTVVEFQHYRRFSPISGSPQDIATVKSLELVDGRAVNFIDEESFEIVETSERLSRLA